MNLEHACWIYGHLHLLFQPCGHAPTVSSTWGLYCFRSLPSFSDWDRERQELFLQALTFHRCNNLSVRNLVILNSQQNHLAFTKCYGVDASHLTVIAHPNSPNTDGIHISESTRVVVKSSTIRTGFSPLFLFTAFMFKIFFLKKKSHGPFASDFPICNWLVSVWGCTTHL